MSLCSSSSSSPWLRRKPRNAFLGFLHIILVTLSFYVGTSEAITTPIRLPASLGYQGRSNACPARCAVSGPNSGNWSLYHNFEQFSSCQESLFYSFSFFDPVDDPDTLHHIYTCTSFGPDWANLPVNTSGLSSQSTAVNSTNGTYQIGSWPSAPGSAVSYSLAALINQFRQYLSGGFAPVNRPTILFASYGSTSVGLYIGLGLQNQGIGDTALAYLEQSVSTSNASLSAQVAMQFCQPGLDSDHIFGLMATGNGTFAGVQEALMSWSKAKCLTYPLVVQNVTALVPLLTPLYINTNTTNVTNITSLNGTSTSTNSTSISARARTLAPRTTCSTITVASGDGCASLAQKCGITGAQFTQYNPASNECSTLQPGEHVCCSAGTLPNFAPTPQPDGTCATYTIQPNDDCSSIAATWSITVAEINSYNTDTWGWSGCTLIYADAIICLSTGNPPMPAVVANAVCGPQVPGTATPPAGTDLSQLNTCPLNACCDIWGQVSSSFPSVNSRCVTLLTIISVRHDNRFLHRIRIQHRCPWNGRSWHQRLYLELRHQYCTE
jgi:LysM repeat protein